MKYEKVVLVIDDTMPLVVELPENMDIRPTGALRLIPAASKRDGFSKLCSLFFNDDDLPLISTEQVRMKMHRTLSDCERPNLSTYWPVLTDWTRYRWIASLLEPLSRMSALNPTRHIDYYVHY